MSRPFSSPRALGLLLGAALAAAGPLQAQAGQGFLFREPAVTVGVRGGFGHASAGSDLFSFATEQLTLGRGDFSGPSLGGHLAFRLRPRLDFVLDGGYTVSASDSEDRNFIEEGDSPGTEDDRPVEQTTRFERAPVTAGLRAYLLPRGRRIGSFAWVPARVAPYVGVGAGAVWYRFEQEGDFVDYETLAIFSDELASSGWAPTAQAQAGVDFALTPRLALAGEMRYGYAKAELSDSFEGFDPIDLSGFSATLGFNFRF